MAGLVPILATFGCLIGIAFAALAASLAARERAWRSVIIFGLVAILMMAALGEAMESTELAYRQTITPTTEFPNE